MKITLSRLNDNGTQTLGLLFVADNKLNPLYYCWTLELPWKWNKPNVSCIPPGEYPCKKIISPNLGECIAINNVPGRTLIRIHSGNFYTQIKGCILVGESPADINGDGVLDVVNSKNTLAELLKILPEEFILSIRGC